MPFWWKDNMPPRSMWFTMAGEGEGEGGGGGGSGGEGTGEGEGEGAGGGTGEGEGDQIPEWLQGLPEELHEHASLQKFTNVEGLAKSYMSAEQMIGRDKIPMPKTDEEWQAVFTRLGRPEKFEEYNVGVPDSLPPKLKEELTNSVNWFKETAHTVGLNHDQASKFYAAYVDLVTQGVAEDNAKIQAEMEDARTTLKSEFGDAYESKLTLANRAIDMFGGPELIELFTKSGMGRNPVVVKAFVKMGERIAEEVGLDKLGQPMRTPGDLQEEIENLQAHEAYLNDTHPAHKAQVAKVQRLMKQLHPEPGAF